MLSGEENLALLSTRKYQLAVVEHSRRQIAVDDDSVSSRAHRRSLAMRYAEPQRLS